MINYFEENTNLVVFDITYGKRKSGKRGRKKYHVSDLHKYKKLEELTLFFTTELNNDNFIKELNDEFPKLENLKSLLINGYYSNHLLEFSKLKKLEELDIYGSLITEFVVKIKNELSQLKNFLCFKYNDNLIIGNPMSDPKIKFFSTLPL
jgi:hypothetical protein